MIFRDPFNIGRSDVSATDILGILADCIHFTSQNWISQFF